MGGECVRRSFSSRRDRTHRVEERRYFDREAMTVPPFPAGQNERESVRF